VCLEQTEEALREALRTGPYGRCVFKCDNNVCDHMSILLEFEGGITATFSLTAQTSDIHRSIHIMCEDGEIEADDLKGTITVTHFRRNQAETPQSRTIVTGSRLSGHGGGDAGIMEDFTASLRSGATESRSSISRSVESHLIACAIEESRISGTIVDMTQYRASQT
jgi:predicted dehydrogenase